MKQELLNQIKDTKYYQYAQNVLSGKQVACEYVKLACQRFFDFLENPNYEFKPKKVQRVINFFKLLKHSTGTHNKKSFILEPWQEFCVANIFGFVHKGTDKRVTKNVYIEVARKNGKALSLDTLIPTPDGWTKMGDLKIGDEIFGQDGKITHVTYLSPIFENHDCFKLTFEDGEEVIADSEHNWFVKDHYHVDRLNYNGEVRTTKELFDTQLFRFRKDKLGREYRFRVPMNKAIELPDIELPVEPYTLGCWLGDGDSRAPIFAGSDYDLEIYDEVSKFYGPYKIRRDKRSISGIDISFTGDKGKHNSKLRNDLKKASVLYNKHIPEIYLRASKEQRLRLLQGLCDTDGCCSKIHKVIEFCQKNQKIADGFCELLSSLGIKYSRKQIMSKCNGKECGIVSKILFYTDKKLPCFRLKRKYDLLKDSLNIRMNYKTITNIERVDSVKTRCITVDNDNHLYLFGKHFTVTHNTAFAAGLALYCLVAAGEPNPEIEMIANSSKQANICFTMAKNFSETLDTGKYFKKYRESLRFFPNKGMLQVLSSEAGLNDGYNSYCFIVDEYHSAQTTENYDVMKSSQGMRVSPLAIVITTAGFNIGGPCYNMRQVNIDILKGLKTDETQFSLIYTLDDGDDWKDPKNWIKVSPNLGITVQEDYYHEQIQQAENNPQLEVGIKTKNFNLWLQTSQTWIPDKYITDAMQPLTYDDLAKQAYYCYQAIDLASVGDLTALSTMTYNEDTQLYYFKVEYFVPATALTEAENNFIYQQWYKAGYLNVTPGNVTDYDFILKRQLEINKQIQTFKCCYDQWNSTQFTINATAAGVNMIPFSQSLGSFNRPTKEFERLILSGKIILDYNPITRWCFQNVALKEDYFENVKPVKGSGQENKIDGCIAILQSLGGKLFDELPDLSITT